MSSDNDSAQVTVWRGPRSSRLSWTVWLDDEEDEAATLTRNELVAITVPVGNHKITVRQPRSEDGEPFSFYAEAGERIALIARETGGRGRIEVCRETRPLAVTASQVVDAKRNRYPVSLGEETQTVDNSRGLSPTKASVGFTRTWTRTHTVDAARTTVTDGEIDIASHIVTIKTRAERTLKESNTVTGTDQEEFRKDVEFEVPTQTKSEATFLWKEIREEGFVELSGDGFAVEVPYKAAVGLTFDWKRVDTPYEPEG